MENDHTFDNEFTQQSYNNIFGTPYPWIVMSNESPPNKQFFVTRYQSISTSEVNSSTKRCINFCSPSKTQNHVSHNSSFVDFAGTKSHGKRPNFDYIPLDALQNPPSPNNNNKENEQAPLKRKRRANINNENQLQRRRQRRNETERLRVKHINEALSVLQSCLPVSYCITKRQMRQQEVISGAVKYMEDLQNLLSS